MKLFNANLAKLTIILAVTSSLSIANIDTSPVATGAVENTFNPTAYTNKPNAEINKSSVVKAQRLLKSKGMLKSSADGIAGFDTKQAVKEYQIEKKLDVTGILNKETLNAMSIDWKKTNKTY